MKLENNKDTIIAPISATGKRADVFSMDSLQTATGK